LHLRALLEQAGVTGGGIRSAVEHFAIEYPSSGRAADTGYTLNRWTGPAPVRLFVWLQTGWSDAALPDASPVAASAHDYSRERHSRDVQLLAPGLWFRGLNVWATALGRSLKLESRLGVGSASWPL